MPLWSCCTAAEDIPCLMLKRVFGQIGIDIDIYNDIDIKIHTDIDIKHGIDEEF